MLAYYKVMDKTLLEVMLPMMVVIMTEGLLMLTTR